MLDRFAVLEGTIKKECGQGSVYYFPNHGNWGDGLIRHATIKFLSDIDVKYEEMTTSKKEWLIPLLRGGTVIYGGGGAWSQLWKHAAHRVNRFRKRFKVIVLPSSYELSYSIPKTIFFRRDHFESKHNMPNATFCHDMVFYLGMQSGQKVRGSGTGYFFRTDTESANRINIPSNNDDISASGDHLSGILPFLHAIDKFSVIHTDRLHVSIAACLLSKEVHLYPGSYFKNKAVYLSSMKDYFENVYFHETFDSYPTQSSTLEEDPYDLSSS